MEDVQKQRESERYVGSCGGGREWMVSEDGNDSETVAGGDGGGGGVYPGLGRVAEGTGINGMDIVMTASAGVAPESALVI